ncbi:g8345 [Coccomyxa elongata]
MKASMMPLAFLAVAMVALLPTSSALPHRTLLQGCQPLATQLINDCNQFLGIIQQNAGLVNPTDAQLQALVAGKTPSPTCCATVQEVLSQGCRCDPTVSGIAASVGIQPSGFETLSRTGILACKLPPNTDTAPNPCPGGSSAGK